MKNKHLLILTTLFLAFGISACNNNQPSTNEDEPTIDPNSPEDGEIKPIDGDDSEGGSVADPSDWDKIMSYDYSNMTAMVYDSSIETPSCVYYLGNGRYADYYYVVDQFYTDFYADYEGVNYKWFDYSGMPGGSTGWVYRDYEYDFPYSLYLQDFYMPDVIKNVSANDVEYSASMKSYTLKSSSTVRVQNEAFTFTYDHNYFRSITFLIDLDKENNAYYVSQIRLIENPEDQNSPYVVIELSDFGTTDSSAFGFPELPNENNIKEIYEINGKGYYPIVEPTSVVLNVEGIKDSEEELTYEDGAIVLELGQSLVISRQILPENSSKSRIFPHWYPDRNDYSDNDGNLEPEFYDLVAVFNNEMCYESGKAYLFANHPGTIEVYATNTNIFKKDDKGEYETIVSNKIKVTVKEPAPQDLEGAIYQLEALNDDNEYNDNIWGRDSGLYQTNFTARNLLAKDNFHPEYEITGYHAQTLPSQYVEGFDNDDDPDKVFDLYTSQPNEGLDSYLDFDLKDQKVDSISFKYSLHSVNHLANFENNLDAFYIQTSEDGINYTNASKNLKDEFIANLKLAKTGNALRASIFKFNFTSPTRYVRINLTSKYLGQNWGFVLSSVVFKADTITHVDKDYVALNTITINDKENNTVQLDKNGSNTLEYHVTLNPNNATNQKVYWTSADHTVASVKPHRDGSVTITPHKVGETKITVYSDEIGSDGEPVAKDEVIVVVLGEATLPEAIGDSQYNNGTSLFVEFNVSSNSIKVTYILSKAYTDTLYLTSTSGKSTITYTFTSSDSKVFIIIDTNDLSAIEITTSNGVKSNIKGQEIDYVILNLAA